MSSKLNGSASVEIIGYMPGSIIASTLLTYTDKSMANIDETIVQKALIEFNQNASLLSLSELNVTEIFRSKTFKFS